MTKIISSQKILLFFLALSLLTVSLASIKFFKPSNSKYTYVTVKLSQGYWWVQTPSPKEWYINNINKNDKQYDFLGNPIAEMLVLRHYPVFNPQTNTIGYDTYLDLKLLTSYNPKTQAYSFNRNKLLVGAPIELEFSSSSFTATIIDISPTPPSPNYQEKTITLSKKNSYPWEYNAIQVGDVMSDGEQKVFEVLEKSYIPTQTLYSDQYGNLIPGNLTKTTYITIKAKVLVTNEYDKLIFAKEYPLVTNISLPIITDNYNYSDFVVGKVE